ncbi:pathogenesis-related protein 1C-like [Impatiens glandulifera]|uniref:pathogenesis-related protein 1C-like n=1 Tax=Impatiens glandulifera TaxID=253017 RepID=UPI001FB14C80|nr:pathogenesis-related protein 1C-like [Impatiens glandulifera]
MSNLQIRIFFVFFICLCIFSQSSSGQLTPDAQEYVDAHNQIRSERGIPPLSWDPTLATFAQYWASQRADDCNPFVHSLSNYGENIMWELYNEDSPTHITQVWAAEEKNFDLELHKCMCQPETSDCMCGHYTQVVWRSTTRIGCGNYTCNNQKGFIVVCSYDPPGNYVGENPFWPLDCGTPSHPPPPPTELPPPPPTELPPPPPTVLPPPPMTTEPPTQMTTQPLPLIPGQQVSIPSLPNIIDQQLQQTQETQKPIFTMQSTQQPNQARTGRKRRVHRRNYRRPRTPKP